MHEASAAADIAGLAVPAVWLPQWLPLLSAGGAGARVCGGGDGGAGVVGAAAGRLTSRDARGLRSRGARSTSRRVRMLSASLVLCAWRRASAGAPVGCACALIAHAGVHVHVASVYVVVGPL